MVTGIHLTQVVMSGVSPGTTPAGVALMNLLSGADDGMDGIPGRPGTDGTSTPGSTGPAGPALFMTAQDGDDGQDGIPIKGRDGIDGAAGAAGAALFMMAQDGDDGQDGIPIKGRDGIDGAAGAAGAALFMMAQDGDDGQDGIPIRGIDGTIGRDGVPGPALFMMLEQDDVPEFMPPILQPGGAPSNVQFHAGQFGGEPAFVWLTATKRMGIGQGTNDTQLHVSSLLNTAARGGTISNHHDDDVAGSSLNLSKSRGTSSAPTDCGAADTISNFNYYAFIGGLYGQQGTVAVKTDGAAVGANFPTSYTISLNGGSGIVDRFKISGLGSVICSNGSALGTTATDGFLYISYTTGIPSGVPTAQGATVPLVVNGAVGQNRLFVYNFTTAAWFDVGLTWVRDNNSFLTYKRKRLNFINGTNVTISTADDSINDEVDITINSNQNAVGAFMMTAPGDDGMDGFQGQKGDIGQTGASGSGSGSMARTFLLMGA